METFKKEIQSSSTLTENSKKNYITKINILIKKEIPIDNTEEQIIAKLKEVYPKSNSTYKTMIYPVIKYREIMKLPTDKLKEEYTAITKNYTAKQEEQTTERELISLDKLKKCKRKIDKNNTQFKLLFSLYTNHPPVRNDYYDLKYQNYNEKKDNYYNSKTKTITLNRFKTSKHYEAIEIKLTKPEITLMNKLIKSVPKKEEIKRLEDGSYDNDYIFYNTKNDVMDSRGFTEMLNREFKKICGTELGSSDLRKIYVSSLGDKSLAERREIASKMGHSPYEAELFYKKLNIK